MGGFSSVVAPGSITGAKMSHVVTQSFDQSIASFATWTPVEAMYQLSSLSNLSLGLYVNGTWEGEESAYKNIAGVMIFDGANMRIYNSHTGVRKAYGQKFG